MKRFVLFLVFACSLAAWAEPIRGVAHNGTTNKPAAGDEVILKRIGNTMEDVGTTKTNSKGEFSFDVPSSPRPYLVWVKHQEVTYTQVAMAGKGPVAVQVFDASPTLADISLAEHVVVLQTSAAGDTLKVDELFTVDNQSSPSRTKNGQHTFDFYLPENVHLQESSAQTPGSMALKTPAVPDKTEKNKYFFGYPLRPGQTQFHLTYTMPYTGKLAITPKLSMPVAHMLVVTPTAINFTPEDGTVYSPTSDPQIKGAAMYLANNVDQTRKLGFEIQGTGAMPREQQGEDTAAQSQGEDNRPGGGLGVPNERPDPLHNSQWLFLGVLTVFLSAGAVYVYTSKQPVVTVTMARRGGKGRSAMLLEAMKEEIFQLESDRLQGKITPQEYDAQKAALDKTLQRAVQRQKGSK